MPIVAADKTATPASATAAGARRKSTTNEVLGRHFSNAYVESGAVWAAQGKILSDPRLYKGLAFTIDERQVLGLHGLLPPGVMSQEQQAFVAMENFKRLSSDLDKYMHMMAMQERNEKLFYKVVFDNIETMLPIIYTPTVGLACQRYGLLFTKPRGLFLTINDKGHLYEIMCNWPEHDIRAICVTDGERISGSGDLGAYGMGIPVGKLTLYTACAKIKPHQCLPITLDVGTNNEHLMHDPVYIGLKKKRASGEEYDRFLDEFMNAVRRRYGHTCLIQFEEFGTHNAFRILAKYRNEYCTFNDDIQGTAAVTVAGLLSSCRSTGAKKNLGDNLFLFHGAGEAAIGTAKLLQMTLLQQGLDHSKVQDRIWLFDSKGLVVRNRPKGEVTGEKALFAKNHAPIDTFLEAVKTLKPTAIIGVSGQAGAFSPEILKEMMTINERPIVFALGSPADQSECTAEAAYTATKGQVVFASGSPFPPVSVGDKTYKTSECSNAYVFPGVALGIIMCGLRHVGEEVFLIAAQEIANMVTDKHISSGQIFPGLNEVHNISFKIAVEVIKWAYKNNVALIYPEPRDIEGYVRLNQYTDNYQSFMPHLFAWSDNNSPMSGDLKTKAEKNRRQSMLL